MFEKYVKWDNLPLPIIIFLLTIITRIPFTSKYLYHMDSVQFALALDRYIVTLHQSHLPGYFLYVMLGRFINIFIRDANTVFVSISIIFSGLTVVAIYFLGKELFDKRTALIAAVIAYATPNFWFRGKVALTYSFREICRYSPGAFGNYASLFFCPCLVDFSILAGIIKRKSPVK